MNIVYCGDKKMEDGLLLSNLSILNHTEEPLHIFVLTMRLTIDTKEKNQRFDPVSPGFINELERVIKEKNAKKKVTLVDFTEIFQKELPHANLDTRFTPYCMLRLFADKIPDITGTEKLLYLDADVICRKDFSGFYHQDLSGYEMAGVADHYGRWIYSRGPLKADYLNSGVLLLNMEEIRDTRLLEKCRELCADKKMFLPDQSALNRLSVSKKKQPRRFNEQRRLHDDTVFQHFTTSFRMFPWLHTVTVKPWEVEKMHSKLKLHEYDALLKKYEELTKEMKNKAAAGKEQKLNEKDQEKPDEEYRKVNTGFLYH